MAENFQPVIDQLVEEIEGLRNSIGPLMQSVGIYHHFDNFRLGRFLQVHGEVVEDKPSGEKVYRVGPAQFGQLRRLDRRLKSSVVAQTLLPGSLLVTLVSRYDAFLGRLIRTMVLTRPELLKSSERTLSLSNLLELGDFESAREYLIEKEIESVLRKSHDDHFAWLETKLDMPLRKDLPSWSTFIELTERRNLLVHCDGKVSHQYLANCRQHGVPLEKINVGDSLGAPAKYYRSACDCILEMAIKLTHVVWRKLLPSDRESADDALNRTCFELLVHENNKLANEILRFAIHVLKKHASEKHRLMFLVNYAQSFKWLNQDRECQSILEKEDWSAKSPDFRLCVSVLREEYGDAVAIMKQLGKDGPVKAENYREWPVFRNARKDKVFVDGYKEIFGEEMRVGESLMPAKEIDIKEFFDSLEAQEVEKESVRLNQFDNADESHTQPPPAPDLAEDQ
jgi:hypothetical protein